MHTRHPLPALVLAGLLVTGCGDSSGAAHSTTPGVVAPQPELRLTPDPLTLTVDDTAQVQAQLAEASGAARTVSAATWTSSDPSVATVDAGGRVLALKEGEITLSASYASRVASARIKVQGRTVASVVVTPAGHTVTSLGDSVRLAAEARDAAGRVIAGYTVAWASLSPAVATVDATGLVRSVGPGEALITANAGAKMDTAIIRVAQVVAAIAVTPGSASLEPGQSATLQAVASDARGHAIPGAPFAWASSAPGVATVSATGVVQGVTGGTASVRATSGGASAAAEVTVKAPAPGPVQEMPRPAAGDSILLDTRAGGRHSIQSPSVTTAAAAYAVGKAVALWGDSRGYTGPGALGVAPLDFTTNFDGRGTHAFRFNWTRAAGNPGGCSGTLDADTANDGYANQVSQHTQYIKFNPMVTGAAREVYLQYKVWAGRTATGGGAGDSKVGSFNHFSEGGPGGHKTTVWFRRSATGSTNEGRITAIAGYEGTGPEIGWQAEAGGAPALSEQLSVTARRGPASSNLNLFVNREMVVTYRIRAESAPNARDGIYQQWTNGQLIIDLRNVGSTTKGFGEVQIGGPTWICPVQDQTMYLYDVVSWMPR